MDNSHLSDVSRLEKDLNCAAVYKRRSSVFQSRVIVFDEYEGKQVAENKNAVDASDTVNCPSQMLQTECFNLEEYVTNLKKERKQWVEILKERKAQRKNLQKQRLCLENQGQPLDLNALTESEKDFVTARPSYQHICKCYKKLSDVTVKISILHNIVYNLNQRFVFQMERRLHKVTDKIIESSGS